jgi:hypothetical protein
MAEGVPVCLPKPVRFAGFGLVIVASPNKQVTPPSTHGAFIPGNYL